MGEQAYAKGLPYVSIRSPYRSKGRLNHDVLFPHLSGFNPLPLPKQGETQHHPVFRVPVRSFNPLPLPKQGETSRRREIFG